MPPGGSQFGKLRVNNQHTLLFDLFSCLNNEMFGSVKDVS